MSKVFTAAVHQEDDWFVAQCLEVDVASQGSTLEEALANLSEAVGLYLAEVEDPHPTATPSAPKAATLSTVTPTAEWSSSRSTAP
jgi:predicted RNase H-like HicB family nuclease